MMQKEEKGLRDNRDDGGDLGDRYIVTYSVASADSGDVSIDTDPEMTPATEEKETGHVTVEKATESPTGTFDAEISGNDARIDENLAESSDEEIVFKGRAKPENNTVPVRDKHDGKEPRPRSSRKPGQSRKHTRNDESPKKHTPNYYANRQEQPPEKQDEYKPFGYQSSSAPYSGGYQPYQQTGQAYGSGYFSAYQPYYGMPYGYPPIPYQGTYAQAEIPPQSGSHEYTGTHAEMRPEGSNGRDAETLQGQGAVASRNEPKVRKQKTEHNIDKRVPDGVEGKEHAVIYGDGVKLPEEDPRSDRGADHVYVEAEDIARKHVRPEINKPKNRVQKSRHGESKSSQSTVKASRVSLNASRKRPKKFGVRFVYPAKEDGTAETAEITRRRSSTSQILPSTYNTGYPSHFSMKESQTEASISNDYSRNLLESTIEPLTSAEEAQHIPDHHEQPTRTQASGRDETDEISKEGLVISVPVQCSFATLHSQFSTLPHQHWPERSSFNDYGSLRVTKATCAKRSKQRSGSYSIELTCDDGPSATKVDAKYQIQWLHMQRCHINLTEFENMCLNAPGIGGEARFLVLRLFRQVKDAFRKRLFDGYHIEPGTVVRCDGSSSRNVDNLQLSATFVCFPYVAVRRHHQSLPPSGHKYYPMRSMLQILYPYESTPHQEPAPSFCRDLPQAAEHAMFVPQCWAVMIGSEYVITCGELTGEDMIGSSLLVVRPIDHVPLVTGDWFSDTKSLPDAATATLEQDLTPGEVKLKLQPRGALMSTDAQAQSTYEPSSMQLFGGLRIEDFLIGDDEPDIANKSTSTIRSPDDVKDVIVAGDELDSRKRRSGEIFGIDESHLIDACATTLPSSDCSAHSNVDTSEDYDEPLLVDIEKPAEVNPARTEKEVAEQEASVLSMLKTLEVPKMTTQFLEKFRACISYIVKLWEQAPIEDRRRQHAILVRLVRSIQCADMLRSMCDLESQDNVFSENLAYRDAMLKALGIGNSSCERQLQSLGEAVHDARSLFTGLTDLNTAAAITKARQTLQERTRTGMVPTTSENRHGGTPSKSLPAALFLARTWPHFQPNQNMTEDRIAAENLFAIMRDVEKSLKKRDETCYKHAPEETLDELDTRMTLLQPQSSNNLSEDLANSSSNAIIRPGPQVLRTQPYSPLRHSISELLAEDAVLRTQQNAIITATNELLASAKRFVGLYIPPRYPNPVCHRIWGSLSRLTKSVTSTFEDNGNSRQVYIIRPLMKEFMQQYSIDQPKIAFADCTLCKGGHIHRSAQDAVSHLKTVHFRYKSHLRQLAHLQTTHRWFVRTETDLRNEFANKQQLSLLRICLNYLNALVARAEKIHAGIAHEGGSASNYQLPDDLIDCFEGTALFLMQAAASVKAIEKEMLRWQHVPGKVVEELNTPAVQHALDKLAELGQSAQASMTKAEKTLALADPERNTINMGPAGPELLVAIILQNLQKRPALDGVDMEINQLHQEHTSKLQYQVNQFPRKRLLRDIQSLQEELSVVQLVNLWQQKSYENFLRVLDPRSFVKPTPERIDLFQSESECLNDSLKLLESKAIELRALENRTQYLREQLKQGVEILEEDHGKAILVFTMITTIFLPLSFIASLFGMNTSDMRNTDKGQGFFWTIAVPVTAGIVFAAVLLAYHGDKLYDTIVQTIHQERDKRKRNQGKAVPLSLTRTWRERFIVLSRAWHVRKGGP